MLIALLIIVFVIALIVILVRRGSAQYKVVNSKGVPLHFGDIAECSQVAKAQNRFFKENGINDKVRVIKWKL